MILANQTFISLNVLRQESRVAPIHPWLVPPHPPSVSVPSSDSSEASNLGTNEEIGGSSMVDGFLGRNFGGLQNITKNLLIKTNSSETAENYHYDSANTCIVPQDK